MSECQPNPNSPILKTDVGLESLRPEETTQLLLASSLSALKPLLGLINFMINEGIINVDKLRAFLEPMLVDDNLPPVAKAMLGPTWKSFLAQIGDTRELSLRGEDHKNG